MVKERKHGHAVRQLVKGRRHLSTGKEPGTLRGEGDREVGTAGVDSLTTMYRGRERKSRG
jgi:hypothetical protein